MSDEAIETIELEEGIRVELYSDEHALNPRKEYDNVGKMICWHRNYDLGDDHNYKDTEDLFRSLAFEIHPELENYVDTILFDRMVGAYDNTPEWNAREKVYEQTRRDIIQKILDKHYIILPLGLYDHSGITMYIGGHSPFDSAGWDSGQVGWIYCTVKQAHDEWSSPKSHEHYGVSGDPNADRKCAEKYLEGEVETYDQYLTGDVYGYVVKDADDTVLDSCWGYYGQKYALSEGKSMGEHHVKDIREARDKAEATERHAQEWEPRMMAI